MDDREARVRAAFASQSEHCRRLGSPFTSLLTGIAAERLDRSTPIGRRILDWEGDPDALHDSVPLRFCGGLNGLVRAGAAPSLAPLYPPGAMPAADDLWAAVASVMTDRASELDGWLDGPPQTNEVARSGGLGGGFATVAAETGLPLALYELGASAGLNLLPDRYDLRLGTRRYGDPASPVRLEPAWTGGDPPEVAIRIASRRGVDRSPLDVGDPADRERLLAYIWPDQAERVARLEGALAIAAANPPSLDREDAASWVEREIEMTEPPAGCARVVFHSIAFQYFPADTQDRIAASLGRTGATATTDRPLAWLRYEADEAGSLPTLRLRTWPGEDRLLARVDPHGRQVEWLGAA